MNQYLSTESKEYQLMALQSRLQVIQEKGKATQGVIRKLQRQIRNLKCDILLQCCSVMGLRSPLKNLFLAIGQVKIA